MLFIFSGQKDFAQILFTLRYGDKCFIRPAIHVWCKKFACGRESVVDKKKTWPMCCFNMLKNKRLMFDI